MHERDILLAALEKTRPDEREDYLTQACGTDLALRRRVEALLWASEVQDSFLEHPAAETELLSPETDGIRRAIAERDELSLDFLQPSDEPDALGRLGTYEVFEVIGRGGMGVVLKARDTKLGRVVAIKVLAPELASNPTARKRFQREAHAAAAVVNQHIVTIHAVDEDRLPYLVMECIAGQSLKEKIDREGHLQLVEILRIGQQVASGLAAAHAHGLIHRDVKPANILLENGVERVRITDFGLARAVDDVGITRTGEVAGTPQYMSPEQAQGLPIDARSDLFSFGCVLYAMCTGRPPFRAETAFATARRICEDTPRPIREVNPEIPQWLTDIIDRLLNKDPAERFQSAKEVAELLGQYLAHAQQPAIIPLPGRELVSPRRERGVGRRQWSVALVSLSLMLAVALGLTEASGVTSFVPTVIRIVRGEGTLVIEVADPTVQVSLNGEELSIRGAGLQEFRLTPGEHRVHATRDGQPVKDELVTITRDGRKVVTVTREGPGGSDSAGGAGSPGIGAAVEKSADEPLTLLAKLDGHSNLVLAAAFLPDGRRMVSVSHDKLARIWDVPTRVVLSTLPMEGGQKAADMSANGRLVAFILECDGKGVARVWDIEKREVVCQFAPELNHHNCIRFTPDGTRLVTSGLTSGVPQPYGVLWDAATGGELGRFDMGDTKGVHEAAFSPDGRLLALGAAGQVRLFDVESREVVADVPLLNPWNVWDLGFAPSGKMLATGQGGGYVSLIDVDSRRIIKTFKGSNANVHSLRFLGHDTFLLTCSNDATLRVWDLERGSVVAQAATGNGTNRGLFVSPDGRQVITAGGMEWDDASRSMKDYGDYALRLWQLPESVWPKKATDASPTNELPSVNSEPGAFVLLGAGNERKFDTLAEAVQSASNGDTIEIRGSGPFVTGPIKLPAIALAIRAGEGYRPVIEAGPDAWDANWWISAHGPLVVEGLEFRGGKIEPQTYGGVLVANTGSPLFVTNCRFVFLLPRVNPIQANDSTNCEIRHCEFLFGPIANNTVVWNPRRDCRLTVAGCIVAGPGLKIFLGYDGAPVEPCSVEFTRNTITGPWAIWLERWSDFAAQGAPLSLRVADNVFDCPSFMNHSDKSGESTLLAPAPALAFVKQLVAYQEQRNVHSGGGTLLWCRGTTGSSAWSPDRTVNDLEAWQRFWEQQATSSRIGSVHFEGGAAAAYATSNLKTKEVTPAAFRLRADSAGYRAGPGGKDLGPDVDLVGPGEAYERWKKTPEYQEWLKTTGQEK